MRVDEFKAIPEGGPRSCPACRVVMLPDREAKLPTIQRPQCGVTETKVF